MERLDVRERKRKVTKIVSLVKIAAKVPSASSPHKDSFLSGKV